MILCNAIFPVSLQGTFEIDSWEWKSTPVIQRLFTHLAGLEKNNLGSWWAITLEEISRLVCRRFYSLSHCRFYTWVRDCYKVSIRSFGLNEIHKSESVPYTNIRVFTRAVGLVAYFLLENCCESAWVTNPKAPVTSLQQLFGRLTWTVWEWLSTIIMVVPLSTAEKLITSPNIDVQQVTKCKSYNWIQLEFSSLVLFSKKAVWYDQWTKWQRWYSHTLAAQEKLIMFDWQGAEMICIGPWLIQYIHTILFEVISGTGPRTVLSNVFTLLFWTQRKRNGFRLHLYLM